MGRVRAVLASANVHKLNELQAALSPFRLELLAAGALPPETGRSYYENALAKALFGRAAAGPDVWLLGEDSGIEVDGLGGEPGLHSARWAGRDDPVRALLRRLDGTEGESRRARYRCELVCLSPSGEELRGTGVLEGEIAREARGAEGFGYDPIFVPEGETSTVAELGNGWKRTNSHRARAAQALAAALLKRPYTLF
jgi:XTP/dITP diphosphohydrolase